MEWKSSVEKTKDEIIMTFEFLPLAIFTGYCFGQTKNGETNIIGCSVDRYGNFKHTSGGARNFIRANITYKCK